MNKNEIDALNILMEKDERGATVAEMASRLDLTRGGALELMKRLASGGFVRGEQQTDQMVWRFWITPMGEYTLFDDDQDLQLELL